MSKNNYDILQAIFSNFPIFQLLIVKAKVLIHRYMDFPFVKEEHNEIFL